VFLNILNKKIVAREAQVYINNVNLCTKSAKGSQKNETMIGMSKRQKKKQNKKSIVVVDE
jgi:hypothetical protein